ncbi:signal protein [Nitrincola sp. A-D6]|uniref:EAL and HDOD domain-containing protein n=1 Tax=Nitrincola sp. A-D6 TaxID=1545442 RepID=UPI00051FD22A|nr:HDOD domain-containing protein [Nitrincola sp. A-D6]KGK42400.1 signal protein [Nitrincola sp. A-D6]
MSKIAITHDDQGLPVLMARQAIYTKSQDVAAYELLFRDEQGNFVMGLKDDDATLAVLVNSYASFSKDTKAQLPFFLKVTDKVLLDDELPDFPRHLFVLELLAHTRVTQALIDRLVLLAGQGYRLALSGFDPSDTKLHPLLKVVHVLKLDIQLIGLSRIPALVQKLKPFNLELLADKVETQDEFRQCLEMGFALYMGYFLSKPDLVRGKKLPGNKMLLLQVLKELQSEHATAESVEQIALKDPELTYKILRVVNSAAVNLRREVNSLSHAIALLGMDQIRRWVMLFLAKNDNGKPTELTRNMLIRGRMCELLAEMLEYPAPMECFIVGLLSQMDVMMDMEMDVLLNEVPLQHSVKDALTKREGQAGLVLSEVEIYERGEFAQLKKLLPSQFYEVAYRHSLKWAEQVLEALQ